MLNAKHRVVDNVRQLELFCEIVSNESLRQLIWSDSVEKIHFVNVLHRLFDGDWIEQITYDHLNPGQGFLVGFAHENPDVGSALFQLFDDFGTDVAGPTTDPYLIGEYLPNAS